MEVNLQEYYKYWIGAIGFIVLYAALGLLLIGKIFFEIQIPFDSVLFVLLCLLWLVKFLLDVETSVFLKTIGATVALRAAQGLLKESELNYERAMHEREAFQEQARIERENWHNRNATRLLVHESQMGAPFSPRVRTAKVRRGRSSAGPMYYLGEKLPFIVMTFIPVVITVVGFLTRESFWGSLLLSYGNFVVSGCLGFLAVVHFRRKGENLLAGITIIGLIAAIIVSFRPPLRVMDAVEAFVLMLQMAYCGIASSINPKGGQIPSDI
jgi:hypothetical protein